MSIRIGCLVIFVGLLTGCTSQDVWQADGEITPSSYNAPSETLGRTIGKLKRLVIIPGIFEYKSDKVGHSSTRDSVEGTRAAALRDSIVSESARFLSEERGYDVQLLDPSSLSELQNTTFEALMESCSAPLAARSKGPRDDGPANPTVVGCVSRIGQTLNADGLIVLNGSRVSDPDWRVLLTLLTASLAWPTLMVQEKIEASASLFEVASGKVVWRGRFSKSAAEPTGHRVAVGFLFADYEHALPDVLVE